LEVAIKHTTGENVMKYLVLVALLAVPMIASADEKNSSTDKKSLVDKLIAEDKDIKEIACEAIMCLTANINKDQCRRSWEKYCNIAVPMRGYGGNAFNHSIPQPDLVKFLMQCPSVSEKPVGSDDEESIKAVKSYESMIKAINNIARQGPDLCISGYK
jgi:hypothetical protein